MRAFLLSLLLASASAFVLPMVLARPRMAMSNVQMKDGGVEAAASACLEEGCPVDLVEELIEVLKIHQGNDVRRNLPP